ncbi:MAG: DAK2 domain-containing protein [Truepera sp.]|nr:DAK2 domain-containing protein [Truepera sp.]
MSECAGFTVRDLTGAFIYATDWLRVYVEEVNALNVYPVPDGDTGTNMHLTMQSVRRQFGDENPKNMREFAQALAYGSLLGARGNSGVILSQVLKGFADEVKRYESIGPAELAAALSTATTSAYAAVVEPVEGTILTVVRKAADGAKGEHGSSQEVLEAALEAGRTALAKTPEQLPLLKQAGVVDAGGLGFLRVLEGVLAYYRGWDLPLPPVVTERAQKQFEEEEFGFCTEFLLAEVTAPTRDIQEVVKPFGDSLLVVGAEGFVKGHIHTEEPERLLATVARFGRMIRTKVEDMSSQHSEILAGMDLSDAEVSESGLVAVGSGYGVTKVLRDLGARVVGGGQTNNPSVEDIADAVRSVGAQQVVVLPNNKNVILAAEHVADLLPEKAVHVLPTKTVGAGLAAAVLFQEGVPVDQQIEDMAEAADHTITFEITTASRDARFDGVDVQEGEIIGLVDGVLKKGGTTPESCLIDLLKETDLGEFEVGTLFFSAAVGEEAAHVILDSIKDICPDLDVQVLGGGPDLYPYLFALE